MHERRKRSTRTVAHGETNGMTDEKPNPIADVDANPYIYLIGSEEQVANR
jgi:hypothetical protein